MKRFGIFCLLFISLGACDSSAPPDYEYRTIIATSPYSNWKQNRSQAMAAARSGFPAFAKGECRRAIANGWSLLEIKNDGEMNCEQTLQGHHCRKKNAELECSQISEFFP